MSDGPASYIELFVHFSAAALTGLLSATGKGITSIHAKELDGQVNMTLRLAQGYGQVMANLVMAMQGQPTPQNRPASEVVAEAYAMANNDIRAMAAERDEKARQAANAPGNTSGMGAPFNQHGAAPPQYAQPQYAQPYYPPQPQQPYYPPQPQQQGWYPQQAAPQGFPPPQQGFPQQAPMGFPPMPMGPATHQPPYNGVPPQTQEG